MTIVRASRRRALRHERAARVAVTALLALVGIGFLLPLLWAIATSLKAFSEVYQFPPAVVGRTVEWSNYVSIWQQYPVGLWVVNSLVVCAIIVVAQVITSSAAGFAFAKLRFRHRDTIFLLYIAGLLVPAQALLVPLFQIIKSLGLIDSPLALVIPALAGPFGTFLFRQFFLSVSDEYIDAARLDGASLVRTYWSVFLPLARGAIGGFAVITFLLAWNSFLWPLIVLRTESNYTATLGLSAIAGGEPFRVPWQLVMAAGVTLMVPIIGVFILAQRQIVQGLSLSGYSGK